MTIALELGQVADPYARRALEQISLHGAGGSGGGGVGPVGPQGPPGPTGPQGPTGGNATVPIDTWHRVGQSGEPAFLNGWQNYDTFGGRDVSFTKDPLGRVSLAGVIKAGNLNQSAFTLPVGYRPRKSFQVAVVAGPGSNPGQVGIDTAGNVFPGNMVRDLNVTISDATAFTFLDGVEFDTGTVTAMPTGPAGPAGATGVVSDPQFQRRQGLGISQTAPGVGASFSFNVAGAPYVDLTPGTWKVEAAASVKANMQDLAIIGLWNETTNAGLGGSGNAWQVVNVTGTAADGWADLSTELLITVPPNTATQRYRIWAIPWSGSTLTIGNPAVNSVPCAFMNAYLIGPGAQGPAGPAGPGVNPGALWCSTGTVVLVGSTETIIPLGTIVEREPNDTTFFTVNANGTLTINQAGWYHVTAGVYCYTLNVQVHAKLQNARLGNFAEVYANTGPNGVINEMGRTVYLRAGEIVSVVANSATANTSVLVREFSIARASGPKGDKGDTGGNATVPMDYWHIIGAVGEPAFTTGWIHYDTNSPSPANPGGAWQLVGFRKDPLGRVHLKGLVGATAPIAAGTAMFTLPVGYRPPRSVIFDTSNVGTGGCRVDVNATNGNVTLAASVSAIAAGSFIPLDHLSFDTESVTQMPTGPQGPKGDTGGNATVPMDTWHTVGAPGEPGFLNGWVPYTTATTPRFRKFPDGTVRLTGLLKGGTLAQPAFSLPIGYRPALNNVEFAVESNAAFGSVYVNPGGPVVPFTGSSATYIALDNVTFDTESVTQMPTGPQGPPGPAVAPPEAWHIVGAAGEPAFGASCTPSATDPPGFRKHLNTVWLRGVVNCPTSGNPVFFTLPAGYRPSITNQRFWPWPGVGFLAVTSGGVVQAFTPANGVMDLSTVSFSVD